MLDINNYKIMIKDFEDSSQTWNVLIRYIPGHDTSTIVDFGEEEEQLEILEVTNSITGEKENQSDIPVEEWYEELLEIARERFIEDLMEEDDIYQYAIEKEDEEDEISDWEYGSY